MSYNSDVVPMDWGIRVPYEYYVKSGARVHCYTCQCMYPSALNWNFCPICGTQLSEVPQIRIGTNLTGDYELPE